MLDSGYTGFMIVCTMLVLLMTPVWLSSTEGCRDARTW